MRAVFIILGVLIFLSLNRLLSSDGGLAEYLALNKQISNLEQEVSELETRNGLLINEVNDLQRSNKSIESIARQTLGMTAKDEVFIKFIETPINSKVSEEASLE